MGVDAKEGGCEGFRGGSSDVSFRPGWAGWRGFRVTAGVKVSSMKVERIGVVGTSDETGGPARIMRSDASEWVGDVAVCC